MNETDETGEIAGFSDGDRGRDSNEPVGRVNLPEESESADEFIPQIDQGHQFAQQTLVANTREKVMYGVLAVIMMILAMVIILQGVFEQKMPI